MLPLKKEKNIEKEKKKITEFFNYITFEQHYFSYMIEKKG
jgi:ABC-type uncharacterized transport system substrate-binding protein